jgi:hypothetical protein
MWRSIFAAMGLLMSLTANAADLYCPPPKFVEKGAEAWDEVYVGSLKSVWLLRMHQVMIAPNIKSWIACNREVGRMQFKTSRLCRLVAGKGRIQVSSEQKEAETVTCFFPDSSTILKNDQSCMIVCDE